MLQPQEGIKTRFVSTYLESEKFDLKILHPHGDKFQFLERSFTGSMYNASGV